MNKKKYAGLFLLLLLFSLVSIYPLFWVIVQSFKTETEFLSSIWTFPKQLQFSNYIIAWSKIGLSKYFMNSIIVTFSTTVLSIVFVACAAYAFAKLNFPLKEFFYYMVIFNLLIPTAIILLPMFMMVNKLKLINTLPALIFPYFQGFAPMGLIIARAYFKELPDELIEAGKLDGCRPGTIFVKIMLPIAKPIIATLAILSSMGVWNEYLWALISITDKDRYTIAVGIAAINDKVNVVGYTPVFASLSISALVIVIIYLCMQKNFIESIAAGAVKG